MIKKVLWFLKFMNAIFVWFVLNLWLVVHNFFSKKILLYLQNFHIDGTGKFAKALVDWLNESGVEYIFLIEKKLEDEFKKVFPSVKYLIMSEELSMHYQHYYTLNHSLFKYFLLNNLQQAIMLQKIMIKTKTSRLFLSIVNPTEFFFSFFVNSKIYYYLHQTPWAEIDEGNKWILNTVGKRKNVKIVTVSYYVKDKINNLWEPKNKNIEVIYNFSDIEVLPKAQKDKFVVITIGRVEDNKNPITFVEVAKLLQKNGLEFMWIGRGDYSFFSETLPPNVHFVGYKKNIGEFLAYADVYLQLSKEEAFGIAVVEAMRFGLPAIVTKYGGTAEIVRDGIDGFVVEPTDVKTIVEKLIWLKENPDQLKMMSDNSRERANSLFTKQRWANEIKKLLNV